MPKAVFTETSFNDVKGYTISLDIKPEGEIGLVSVEYDTRNLRVELVNEEAGSVSGYLVGVRSEGSIISFDVLARDIKDLGRYSVVVNYDLVLPNGKTKAITIEEYVFEAVRIEEKPNLVGGLAVHTVVRGITSGTGATSGSAEDGNVEELSRKLEALTQEIQTLKQKASEKEENEHELSDPDHVELLKNAVKAYEYKERFFTWARSWVTPSYDPISTFYSQGEILAAALFGFLQIDSQDKFIRFVSYWDLDDIIFEYTEDGKNLAKRYVERIASEEVWRMMCWRISYLDSPSSMEDGVVFNSKAQREINHMLESLKSWAERDTAGVFAFFAPYYRVVFSSEEVH